MLYAPLPELGKTGRVAYWPSDVRFRDRRHGGAIGQRGPRQLPEAFIKIFHGSPLSFNAVCSGCQRCTAPRFRAGSWFHREPTAPPTSSGTGGEPPGVTRHCRMAPVWPCRHSSRCPGLTRGAASYGLQLVYSPWRLRYVQNRWRVAPDSNRLPPAVLRVCFRKHLPPVLPPAPCPCGDIYCLGIILTSVRSLRRISSAAR